MNTIILQTPDLPETIVTVDRIGVIMVLLANSVNKKGDIAEVGTYKGGVGHYLNLLSNNKKVFLFDTFEGIPMKDEIDRHSIGDFNDSSYDEVKKYFEKHDNVKVVKGLFPDSADGVIDESDKFCFVHIDADQYESTLNALSFFYNKVVPNGVIVFDDYGWLRGVDKAINNFFADKPEKPIQATSMQCFIFKQ